MRLRKQFVVVIVFTLLIAACMQVVVPSIAHASTSYTWTGQGNDGQWTDASNWNPNGVPGAGDTVTLGPNPTASVTIPTGTTVQNLTLEGNANELNGGSLTITGTFTWMGYGNITTSLDIPAGATANIINATGESKRLLANLSVEGSASLSGSGLLLGQVVITNTGTFTFEPGSNLGALSCCVTPAQFINQGNVVVPASTSGTQSAIINGVTFNDQGTVSIGSSSILDLQVAPSTFASGITFSGAGTLLMDYDADIQLSGTVNLGSGTTFQLGSPGLYGVLNGTGTLTGTGSAFSWVDGTLNGTFTVASSVTTTISGTDQKLLQSPGGNGSTTLNLAGPTTLSGTGLVFSGEGAILNNTGTFSPQAGSTITAQSCCVSPAQFNNKGTLMVSVGAGNTFSVSSLAFNNSGTVNLKSGTFQFGDSGYTQTAGNTKLSGGSLVSTDTAHAIVTLNGGQLSGKGTITSTVQNGALIDPGSTVPGEGLITIVGTYTQTSKGTLREDIKGAGSPGVNYDQLSVNGTATLNGTLNIQTASGFTPTTSDQFTVVKATTLTGKFATLLNYQLPNNLEYYASYSTTAATLKVKNG